jgi:DDE superfamily endonuclease.
MYCPRLRQKVVETIRSCFMLVIIVSHYLHAKPRRRKFSLREKINLASIVRRIRCNSGQGPSLKALVRARGIAPCQLRRWEKQLDSMIQQLNVQGNKASLNTGRKSVLAPIKDDLLIWLSNLRQDGVPVSIRMLATKATEMLPAFGEKRAHARYMAVSRLLKSNGFSIRSATRVAQSSSEAVQDLANQFMDHVRPLLSLDCRDKQWIMNMDQTAMFFSMKPRTTIDEKGRRTVTVRDTKNGDSRITVAVSITADGRVLKPFLVMKGKKHSCIESIVLFIIFIIPLTSVVHT